MLYVGLDLSRKRLDFDVLLAGGERLERGAVPRMRMVSQHLCGDWAMRTGRCWRRSSR
jgi:hypothetical protein